MRVLRSAGLCLFVLLAGSISAAVSARVESSRPVPSPENSQSLVIDHIFQVVDGEEERFSGRLMVRVLDADGTTTRRRALETAQIRILHPAQWLNERWAAFSYSIAKNANGVVYVDSETGRLLQVEFVSVSRRMGATNSMETELTDFEVVDYGTTVSRIRCIPFKDRPVFPISMKPLPAFQNRPFGDQFLADLEASLAAAEQAAAAAGFAVDISLEQASESFNHAERHGAVLGCEAGGSAGIIFPLNSANTTAGEQLRFVKLPQDVTLFSCMADIGENDETEPAQQVITDEQFRFTTSWKSNSEVVIEKEVFDPESEDETPKRIPVYAINLAGEVKKVGQVSPAPVPRTPDVESTKSITAQAQETAAPPPPQPAPEATRKPEPVKKLELVKNPEPPAKKTPQKRTAATASPLIAPGPTTPVPEPRAEPTPRAAERRGFLRRILPGGKEQETPAAGKAQ